MSAKRQSSGSYCRVPVLHLSPAEIGLLRTVLGAGGTRFAIVRGEVVAPRKDEAEVVAAVRWARGLHADDVTDEVTDDDDGDGFEPSGREPVVKPPRGALADGRHEASRWRRLSGGLLDETLVGAPIVLAAWAGASAWWLVLLHLLYTAVPMVGWGWTLGKLCTRTRVIDRTSLGLPSPAAVLARWCVAAVPVIGGVSGLLHGDLIGLAALVVYAPVMVCLRGLHDLAAGTVVVERYRRD